MHVLDYPIEKQKEQAEMLGMSHDEWVKTMTESRKMAREHSKAFQWGVRPDGWTDEDAKRFQAKIDSTHQ